MTVGLIGYGRFGKFAARIISKRATVLVFDKKSRPVRSPSKRIRKASLHEAATQPVVILAVPISSLQQTLRSISPLLKPGTLVVDVCAVKAMPVKWMKDLLPRYVSILGTHPLFGPDSAATSLEGHRIVLCPERITPLLLRDVVRELKGTGLATKTMSPDQHDAMIAKSLFLSQYIGRLVSKAGARHQAFSTKSYEHLLKIVRIADNDTRELFRDMWKYNRHAKVAVRRIRRAEKRMRRELQ